MTIGLVLALLWGALAGWWALQQLAAVTVRQRGGPAGEMSQDNVRRGGLGDRTGYGVHSGRGLVVETTSHDPLRRGETNRMVPQVVGWLTDVVAWPGRAVRGLARRPAEPASDRRWGLVLVATLLLLAVHPILAVAPLVAATVGPRLAERRRERRHTSVVVDELPDVVDLLRLTTLAGLPVTAAVTAIGGRPGGVIGSALSRAAAQVAHGATTADTLAMLQGTAGPPIRPLVDALADHDRYGAALAPALDRLAVETRLQRRRQAEEAARRLPVSLLFPLVLTVLPAYVALTIVPLLVGSFSSLHL